MAEAKELKGWVRVEDEASLTLRRRSTGATINVSKAGISFAGNHQNGSSTEGDETPDVLREVLDFYHDVQAAAKAAAKASKEAMEAAKTKRSSTSKTESGGGTT